MTRPGLRDAFLDADRNSRVRHARIGCQLALALMPAGVLVDAALYPRLVPLSLAVRGLCDLGLMVVLFTLGSSFGARHIRLFGVLWALLPALSLAVLIAEGAGATSVHADGMMLVMMAVCLLMPWTRSEVVVTCGITVALYVAACAVSSGVGTMIGPNTYFLVLTAIICVAASKPIAQRRFADFHDRHLLDRSNQALLEDQRQRLRFLADISHELRTPLALVLAPLEDALAQPTSATTHASLILAHANAQRLLKLTDDLLDLLRLDEVGITPEGRPLDLDGVISSVMDDMEYLARDKGVTLERQAADGSAPMLGDAQLIGRVVTNLVDNAISYARPGDRVSVRSRLSHGQAMIEVADNGPGIAAEELPHLFRRFHSPPGPRRTSHGTGIGLSLTKSLVESHGGSISCTSVPGKGTTMTVALASLEPGPDRPGAPALPDRVGQLHRRARRLIAPAATVPHQAGTEAIDGSLTTTATLLIVEDDAATRCYLQSRLEREYLVITCADAQQALAQAGRFRPDLILLDGLLPDADGMALCTVLRELPGLAATRIVLLTALARDGDRIRGLTEGADDVIIKPFSPDELCARLRAQLRTAALTRALDQRNRDLVQILERLGRTEHRLVQAEKMNALGTLAAGLIHEINNPLNTALTAAAVARRLCEDPELTQIIDDLTGEMGRIRRILANLRSFAQPEAAAAGPVALGDVVRDALALVQGETVGIAIRLDIDEVSTVRGARSQLTHVVTNLLINACRAIRDRQSCASPSGGITIEGRPWGGRMSVAVADDGVGIPERLLGRIFDPFYTTREPGDGIGLGLSICRTIVANHGGELQAESRAGQGTRMHFDLPLYHPEDLP